MALGVVVTVVLALLVLAAIIYGALAFRVIARKLDAPRWWLIIVPLGNLYQMTVLAGVQWWTLFLSLIPFVGLFVSVWWLWKICQRRNYPGWWSLLFLIPLVNLVILGIVAWKDRPAVQGAVPPVIPPPSQPAAPGQKQNNAKPVRVEY